VVLIRSEHILRASIMAGGELTENLCGARERRRWATCGAPAQAGEEIFTATRTFGARCAPYHGNSRNLLKYFIFDSIFFRLSLYIDKPKL